MMLRWLDKNVDLNLLLEHITLFFATHGFRTRTDKLKDGWMVSATKVVEGYSKSVHVEVSGQPDDFSVNFSYAGYGRELKIIGPFVAMFGFGALIRREARWIDFFETVERDFWAFMENYVADIQAKRD